MTIRPINQIPKKQFVKIFKCKNIEKKNNPVSF